MHPAPLVLETLRLRDGRAPDLLRADWAVTPLPGLERFVEFEGCALWLHRRLRQIGGGDATAPVFATWLARRAREDAAQNLLVDAQVAAILRLLALERVPHVLLKGAARRAVADRFPFADARATHDVDVLVPAPCAPQLWQRLRGCGYELAERAEIIPLGHFHLPALWDRSRVAVEIHTSTSPFVAPAEAWRRINAGARVVARSGVRMRVPAATELLWHGLTHALRHHADAFRLRFLLDGAAILAGRADIDWAEIARRLDSREIGSRAAATVWLCAAARLGGAIVPPRIADGIRFDQERVTRWRFAVLRLLAPTARLAHVLVVEGTRLETQLGWDFPTHAASPLHGGARRLRAAAARAVYRLWRARSL